MIVFLSMTQNYRPRKNFNNKSLTPFQLILYGAVMALVSAASCITVFIIYRMTSKIQKFALDVSEKTNELEAEKRLTDRLLYDMIPRYGYQIS